MYHILFERLKSLFKGPTKIKYYLYMFAHVCRLPFSNQNNFSMMHKKYSMFKINYI